MSGDTLKRVKSVKRWLEKAENSYSNHKELTGEMNLIMAQAEMQRLKEVRRDFAAAEVVASRRRAGCGRSAFPRRLFFEGQFFCTCAYSGKTGGNNSHDTDYGGCASRGSG